MNYSTHLNVIRFYPFDKAPGLYTEFLFKLSNGAVVLSAIKNWEEYDDGNRKERDYTGLNAEQLVEASQTAAAYMNGLRHLHQYSKDMKADYKHPEIRPNTENDLPTVLKQGELTVKEKFILSHQEALTKEFGIEWQHTPTENSFNKEFVFSCYLSKKGSVIDYSLDDDSFLLDGDLISKDDVKRKVIRELEQDEAKQTEAKKKTKVVIEPAHHKKSIKEDDELFIAKCRAVKNAGAQTKKFGVHWLPGEGNGDVAYVIESTNEVLGFNLINQSYFMWDKDDVKIDLTEEQVDKKISDHKHHLKYNPEPKA